MSPEEQAILRAMAQSVAQNPAAVAELRDRYGIDLAGDPAVALGADPSKVRQMTHPLEKQYNWGAYTHDDDQVALNPDIPVKDYQETAQHEFRHRGAHLIDRAQGIPQDFNLEELAMLMADMSSGIGTLGYNTDSIGYLLNDYAIQNAMRPMDVLRKADANAHRYNTTAKDILGAGAAYQTPVDLLIGAMIPANVGGPR